MLEKETFGDMVQNRAVKENWKFPKTTQVTQSFLVQKQKRKLAVADFVEG